MIRCFWVYRPRPTHVVHVHHSVRHAHRFHSRAVLAAQLVCMSVAGGGMAWAAKDVARIIYAPPPPPIEFLPPGSIRSVAAVGPGGRFQAAPPSFKVTGRSELLPVHVPEPGSLAVLALGWILTALLRSKARTRTA